MISELKISKREYITIEYDKGTYIILGKNKYLNVSDKKIKLESKLPKAITSLIDLLADTETSTEKTIPQKKSLPTTQNSAKKTPIKKKVVSEKLAKKTVSEDFIKPEISKEPDKIL